MKSAFIPSGSWPSQPPSLTDRTPAARSRESIQKTDWDFNGSVTLDEFKAHPPKASPKEKAEAQ
jgi:hypothetical protein